MLMVAACFDKREHLGTTINVTPNANCSSRSAESTKLTKAVHFRKYYASFVHTKSRFKPCRL